MVMVLSSALHETVGVGMVALGAARAHAMAHGTWRIKIE
jgi:hypothetical protein